MRQIDVFRFWLPLFASWLLMMAEGPLVAAAINRLPDAVVMLAAFGIVISLAVLIESPIINLMATATALVHDRASYLQVRRYTVHWMVLLTAVQAAVAFTPLFDLLVLRWIAVPEEVADKIEKWRKETIAYHKAGKKGKAPPYTPAWMDKTERLARVEYKLEER